MTKKKPFCEGQRWNDESHLKKTDGISICQMTQTDCEQVSHLQEKCFAVPWSFQSINAMFDHPGYHNLVAWLDGRIIGYIGILAVLDEADITNVAVDPDFRRKKIGMRLLNDLIILTQREGIRHIYLEVRQSNQAAIHLYEKAGFARIDVRKDYYDHPVENAVIMMR